MRLLTLADAFLSFGLINDPTDPALSLGHERFKYFEYFAQNEGGSVVPKSAYGFDTQAPSPTSGVVGSYGFAETGMAAGSETDWPLRIADGSTAEIDGPSAQSVTFTGDRGTLKLDDPQAFTGMVSGLTGADAIDLSGFGYGSITTASYLGNAAGGWLTVTDGAKTARIALSGNYLSSTWTLSSDGNGGTTVVDPRTSTITITEPSAETVTAAKSVVVAGTALADRGLSATTPITLTVTDTAGTLSMTNAAGAALAGSRTKSITVTDTLANLNADLATLTYSAGSTAGSDTLTLAATAGTAKASGHTSITITAGSSGGTNNFSVSNGQILDPNGNQWHGYGVAVYDADAQAYGAGLASTLESEFPGINLVRLAGAVGDSPASYAPFINAMTADGAVVVIEDHPDTPTVLTGSALTAESSWYASMASYYNNNPHVLYQTMNEPAAGDASQMQATYNALRGTGYQGLIFMEAGEGAGGIAGTLGNTSVFSSMSNVAWDLHAYDWQSNYSTSVSAIQSDLNSRIATYQAITSASGTMPVISLETGQATNGLQIDPGGSQEIQAAFTDTKLSGACAWAWDNWGSPGLANSLTNSGGSSLTSYGKEVAGYIASHG